MAGSPTCEAIQPGDPMESLNQTLFLWLNAPEHPSALALTLAVFFAERLIWAMPLVIGIGWPTTRAQASGDDSSSGN